LGAKQGVFMPVFLQEHSLQLLESSSIFFVFAFEALRTRHSFLRSESPQNLDSCYQINGVNAELGNMRSFLPLVLVSFVLFNALCDLCRSGVADPLPLGSAILRCMVTGLHALDIDCGLPWGWGVEPTGSPDRQRPVSVPRRRQVRTNLTLKPYKKNRDGRRRNCA
jgi:hypothetical protein